jgi:predicted HAD superfamily Cof-like phosphohydrolase
MSVYDLVKEFHLTYDAPIRTIPNIDVPEKDFRLKFIKEEFITELDDAFEDLDEVEILDALGDTVYVSYGASLTFGIDLRKFLSFDDFDYVTMDRRELFARLKAAFEAEDVVAVGHWLAEIVTFSYMLADERGVDLDVIIKAIHESNMTKLAEDGSVIWGGPDGKKVLKGPNFVPPTEKIREILGV